MAGLRGRVFGGYQLTDQLGGTGFAEVYRATPTTGGREAVIKIIYPEFARQPGFLPNFRHIVSFSGKLVNHPHILPVLASGEEQGYLYLASPYVEHGTLRTWMQAHPRLNAADAAPFFRQLCGAVAYAHSLGIVHGNLKPSNVYLFEGRHVLLGDFGLLWDIRHLDMEHAGSGSEVVEYCAPETFSSHPGQAADIYSLGALLFALLSGHAPFTGARPRDIYLAHTEQPVPHLAQIDVNLPPQTLALDAIIQRAMAKRPQDRYPSAMAIVQAIELALASMPTPQANSTGAPAAHGQPPTSAIPAQGILAGGFVTPSASVGAAPAASSLPVALAGPSPLGPTSAGLATLYPPFPPLAPQQAIEGGMEHLRDAPDAPGSAAASHTPFGKEREHIASNLEIPHTARIPAPPRASTEGASASVDRSASTPATPILDPPARALQPSAPLGDDRFDFGSSMRVADQMGRAAPRPSAHLPTITATPVPPSQNPPSLTSDQIEQRTIRVPVGTSASDNLRPLGAPISASLSPHGRSQPASRIEFSPTSLELPHLTEADLSGQLPSDWDQPAQASQYVPGRAAPAWGPSATPPPQSFSFDDEVPFAHRPQVYSDLHGQHERYDAEPSQPQSRLVSAGRSYNDDAFPHQPGQDTFASQRVWTTGTTAVRPRHRWLRPLLLILLLLLIGDSALVVLVRPQLCPTSACATFSRSSKAFLQSHLHLGSTATGRLEVPQTPLTLKTVVDGTASASLAFANTGTARLTWQATATLPWVTPSASSGTLDAGQQVQVALSAQPRGVKPQAYSGTLTIATNSQQVQVPFTVVVGAGPQLAASPGTLTFGTCGTSEALAVSNTGGGPLNFTASPSATNVMTLDTTSGTLNPGESKKLNVTLSCSAQANTAYAIILVSNGGSTQVKVRYTS